jgi:hypothetical protein
VATPTPFSFRVEAVGEYILQILVEGHLGAGEATDYLRVLGRMVAEARRRDPNRPIALLYIDRLSGFESLKVPRAHGEFFRAVSADVDRIAVVTRKTTVTFGLAVVKLIASPKQQIKAFDAEEPARRWLLSPPDERAAPLSRAKR